MFHDGDEQEGCYKFYGYDTIRFIILSRHPASMPFDFTFRTLERTRDLKQLIDFLLEQDLRYPHYDDWVQRAECEIDAGYKVAITAYSGDHIVGDLIFQRHKQIPRLRELKNVRIHPEVRRRDFAHFMLRQAEVERAEEYDAIICDVRSDQRDVINLLRFSGYKELGTSHLYDAHNLDITMVKTFDKRSEEGLSYRAEGLVLGRAA